MVYVKEVDICETGNFKRMRSVVLVHCDPNQGKRFIPNVAFRNYFSDKCVSFRQWMEIMQENICDDTHELNLYVPSEDCNVNTFDDRSDLIRCWFVYFYRELLPRIFNSDDYKYHDWMYERIFDTLRCLAGWEISGDRSDYELTFSTTRQFNRRSKIVLDVINTWVPVKWRQLMLAKIPKIDSVRADVDLKKSRHHFGLMLAMFEFSVVTHNEAIWQPDAREVVHRILDYLFLDRTRLDVGQDAILKPFFSVVEISKIAAELTLKRLITSRGILDLNQKLIIYCFNESRFNFELFTNVLVRALKPSIALTDLRSRQDAKRALQIAFRILKINQEVEMSELRRDCFILPGKYALVLAQERALQKNAEKLSEMISKTYPDIQAEINDPEHVFVPLNFTYDW